MANVLPNVAPPPYATPFLDWDDARLALIDGRQSIYKKLGNPSQAVGAGAGKGGTLVSREWMLWLNELVRQIDNIHIDDNGLQDQIADLAAVVAAIPPPVSGMGTFSVIPCLLNPSTLPTGLTPADAYQVLAYATDYDRVFIWTGTAFRSWNHDAGHVSFFMRAPGNGWVICSGGAAKISNSDGTLTDIVVPSLTDGVFVKGGTSYNGPNATPATAPDLNGVPGGSVTGSMPSHVHAYTPTGTVAGNLPNHEHEVSTNLALGRPKLIANGTNWGVTGTNAAHTHTLTPVGTLAGNLPDHSHIVSGNLALGRPKLIADGTNWGVTGTVASHTHTVTPSGTLSGNLPDHKHGVSGDASGGSSKVAVSSARQGSGTGTAWVLQGTVAGSLVLPAHTHNGVALNTGGALILGTDDIWGGEDSFVEDIGVVLSGSTGSVDLIHSHDSGSLSGEVNSGPDDTIPIFSDFPSTANAASDSHRHDSVLVTSGFTGDALSTHSHDAGAITVEVDAAVAVAHDHWHKLASSWVTGGITSGPIAISASSGLTFTNTSADHFHNLEGETAGITATSAISMTFTGASGTTSGTAPAWTPSANTADLHNHIAGGVTDGVYTAESGPIPITMTFSGTLGSTSSASIVWTASANTADLHNHIAGGVTDGLFLNESHDPIPLVIAFTGNASSTSGYTGDPIALTLTYTGGKGTLAVGTNGEPKCMTLMPYLRL